MTVAGSTRTSMPRSDMFLGVAVLIPRSTAATRYLVGVPRGGLTVYGCGVVTILARSAPVIPGLARMRSSSRSGSPVTVETAARIAPCSRSRIVRALVPVIATPVIPWALSSASRLRCARPREASRAGSRLT